MLLENNFNYLQNKCYLNTVLYKSYCIDNLYGNLHFFHSKQKLIRLECRGILSLTGVIKTCSQFLKNIFKSCQHCVIDTY